MLTSRLEAIVRQFKQNGMKLLLEDARNVQDPLALLDPDWLSGIDFTQIVLDRTTYVQRDYRHIEADLVFHAPWRPPDKVKRSRRSTLYILIEHQLEPDPLMILRVIEYVIQIYKAQLRRHRKQHDSDADIQFQPVAPIVFYTGARGWESLGQMADLVAEGARFSDMVPQLKPLFVNLRALAPEHLESAGGYFGWLLRLVQERRARREEFRALVERVIEHLETMPAAELERWKEMLSYISALVYHDRDEGERQELQETIESSVYEQIHRREVHVMGRTIAEALEEKGRKKGKKEGRMQEAIRTRRKLLIRQLEERFGEVPPETAALVKASKDTEELDAWLIRLVKANTLKQVGIG